MLILILIKRVLMSKKITIVAFCLFLIQIHFVYTIYLNLSSKKSKNKITSTTKCRQEESDINTSYKNNLNELSVNLDEAYLKDNYNKYQQLKSQLGIFILKSSLLKNETDQSIQDIINIFNTNPNNIKSIYNIVQSKFHFIKKLNFFIKIV